MAIIYILYAETSALRASVAFCDQVFIGSEAERIPEKALEAGANSRRLKWFRFEGEDRLFVIFNGVTPLSRRMCVISAKEGRIISKRVAYLD